MQGVLDKEKHHDTTILPSSCFTRGSWCAHKSYDVKIVTMCGFECKQKVLLTCNMDQMASRVDMTLQDFTLGADLIDADQDSTLGADLFVADQVAVQDYALDTNLFDHYLSQEDFNSSDTHYFDEDYTLGGALIDADRSSTLQDFSFQDYTLSANLLDVEQDFAFQDSTLSDSWFDVVLRDPSKRHHIMETPGLDVKHKVFDLGLSRLLGPDARLAWRLLCFIIRTAKKQNELATYMPRINLHGLLTNITCFDYTFRFLELAASHRLFTFLKPEDTRLLVNTMLDIVDNTTCGTRACERASQVLLHAPVAALACIDLCDLTAKLHTLDAHRDNHGGHFINLISKCAKTFLKQSQATTHQKSKHTISSFQQLGFKQNYNCACLNVLVFLETFVAAHTTKARTKSLAKLARYTTCSSTKTRVLAWAKKFVHAKTCAATRGVLAKLISVLSK